MGITISLDNVSEEEITELLAKDAFIKHKKDFRQKVLNQLDRIPDTMSGIEVLREFEKIIREELG